MPKVKDGLITFRCATCGWESTKEKAKECNPCRNAAARKKWNDDIEENREACRLKMRMVYAKNPEKYRERSRQGIKKYAEAIKARKKIRYEWIQAGDVTKDQLIELYRTSGEKCYRCGVEVRPVFQPKSPCGFDHLISRTNGGRHTISNLAVCCRSCNVRKGAKDDDVKPSMSENSPKHLYVKVPAIWNIGDIPHLAVKCAIFATHAKVDREEIEKFGREISQASTIEEAIRICQSWFTLT